MKTVFVQKAKMAQNKRNILFYEILRSN